MAITVTFIRPRQQAATPSNLRGGACKPFYRKPFCF